MCRDYIEKVDHGRIHFGIIKFVAVVLDRYKLGFEEVAGKVWPGESFEGSIDGNLEYVGPLDGDILGISEVTEVGRREFPDGEVLSVRAVGKR